MTRTRLIRIAILSLVALVAAAGAAYWQVSGELEARRAAPAREDFVSPYAAAGVGGPFELVDHTGATVTRQDFRGRFLLIYFGYTYCPDVCPTELYEMVTARDMLGERAGRVQPVFVSIDPERDTVERMADYVALYHPDLIGLTGSPDQIEAAAQAYRVFYRRVESPEFAEYLMDHSSQVYLVGPEGRVLDMFSPGTAPEAMAERIGGWLAGTA
jgi:protein SCO1/2